MHVQLDHPRADTEFFGLGEPDHKYRVICRKGTMPLHRERGVACELASQIVVWAGRGGINRQSQNRGVTPRCFRFGLGCAHAIQRAETAFVAPVRRHRLIHTPSSAGVLCPKEVKVSCDSIGSPVSPCAQSCLAGLEEASNPYGAGLFFRCQRSAPCSLSYCTFLRMRLSPRASRGKQ